VFGPRIHVTNTNQAPVILFWGRFNTHATFSFTIILIAITILLISFLIFYFRLKNNREPKAKLDIPSWKTLELASQKR
jgi:hypothetical protein